MLMDISPEERLTFLQKIMAGQEPRYKITHVGDDVRMSILRETLPAIATNIRIVIEKEARYGQEVGRSEVEALPQLQERDRNLIQRTAQALRQMYLGRTQLGLSICPDVYDL